MKKHTIAAVALAAALGLTGCSAGGSTTGTGTQAEVESEPTPTETKQTPVENIDKTWTFDYKGATGTFNLGDEPAGPEIDAVEAARATVDGKQYTLVPVTLDNTNGTESLNMYGLTVITKDGQQLDSIDLSDVFADWRDTAGDDTDKVYDLTEASNKYALFDLQPGAKGTALVAFDEPITSAWRVTVAPSGGFDQVEATAS
ncbi:hypothetical protein [Curtobacterium sp. P97]|uniref:hypothetical protein n=1 Tax=Curtobacterium sp. P97 TaxID=2939562 RepID=UPI00203BB0BF|nr:hypothetical protein [Curtobacterium sp. P97]MCM3521794.1 hypothetical protein [Curtobacterium sp. P97]